MQKTKLIEEFYKKIKTASKELTKKEAFKDLLNRLYHSDAEIIKIVDKITLGAETTILNIPRADRLHKGSADTLYNRIIIEFENDLRVTNEHAKEQLAGYMLGQFKTGEGYNFTLIASDFINWKVYSPDLSCLDKLDTILEDEVILKEVESASFVLSEKNAEEFYYWIDRFLFREEKQRATLKRIEEAFGHQSNVFIESLRELKGWYKEAKKFGEVQVAYEQWHKFLSFAYGTFEGSEENFLIHTYLSVFSKMLAYSVVSNDDYIDNTELKEILSGELFHRYNIRNFVDSDFFHWVNEERNFRNLKKVFRLLANEIANFDFENVDEDILKGVYQELIDIDTRHTLGEYYTPDWLCERIVNEFEFKESDKILDPSCGSGSFLRAALHRIKKLNPELKSEQLNEMIYGIDIHPLSVQIAKTTVLLALGKDITKAKKPVHINVILANTLLAPEGVHSLFGSEFEMKIDKMSYKLNTQVLEDVQLFDEALEICEKLADQTMNMKNETIEVFTNILQRQLKSGINKQISDSFYQIYDGFKIAKEKGRDSIWKFIVQNLYKPYFYKERFNFVIGNPPWFTYSAIRNEEYQNTLNELAVKYNVKPEKVANFPHLEIAAIFLAYCSSYFLKNGGKIAFVLPRSFFSADHHDNTRSGKAEGFKISGIWDFQGINPLFRVPSCAIFADKTNGKKAIPAAGIDGSGFTGKLKEHNCNLETAKALITETPVKWHYVKQGGSSAFSNVKTKASLEENPYKKLFRQGATIVPRSFYFVDINQEMPDDFEDRIINIKTAETIKADAKKPWKDQEMKGKMESRFFFRTALAKSILPFTLYKPDIIVLPVMIKPDETGKKKTHLYSSLELRREGYLEAAKWFKTVENIWDLLKTDKSSKMSSNGRLDFQKGLTEQNLEARYLVLYNTSGKDANCAVIDRNELKLEFITDHKNYLYSTDCNGEAHYLSAILNSSIPNERMKDFQTTGLFGARDIHKKILDIYYPKFDENNDLHIKLAELSGAAHKKAKEYLEANPLQKELSANLLGRLRLEIKKHLSAEMKEIDLLVKKVVG